MLELVVHVLPHISFAILLCEHVGAYFTHSRTSTCCFDCLVSFLLPSGWTRMPKNPLYLSMLFSSQTLFMLHHKIWSSQIRTTLCEEHSESLSRHRLKLPKPLCDSRSDRSFHFGPTEIIKLIWVFNLGATDLNFSIFPICCNWTQLCMSVPPSCSTQSHRQGRAIYSHGQNFGNFSEVFSPALSPLCLPGSPDRPPRRQLPPAAGLRHRQRESSPPLSP